MSAVVIANWEHSPQLYPPPMNNAAMSRPEFSPSSPPGSPHAYARYHGLYSEWTMPDPKLLPPWHSADYALEGDDISPDGACEPDLQYDWQVDSETIEFLRTMTEASLPDGSLCESICCFAWSDLKIDLPALSEDHGIHMRRLISRYNRVTTIDKIKTSHLSLEDAQHVSSIPASMRSEGSDQLRLRSEKLQVSADVTAYLGEALLVDGTTNIVGSLEEPIHIASRLKEDTPVITFLSSPTLQVTTFTKMLSDTLRPSPPRTDDFWTEELEQEVLTMLNESLEPASEPMIDISVEDMTDTRDAVVEQAGTCTMLPLQELRVTSPLVPLNNFPYPNTLEVGRQESAAKVITESCTGKEYPPFADMELEDDMSDVLYRLAEDDHKKVKLRLAAEGLIEIDTTLKLPLPSVVDMNILEPWSLSDQQPDTCQIEEARQYVSKDERRWKGISKLERSLHWTPFDTSRARVAPEDRLNDEIQSNIEQHACASLSATLAVHQAFSQPCAMPEANDDMLEPLLGHLHDAYHPCLQADTCAPVEAIPSTDSEHVEQNVSSLKEEVQACVDMRTLLRKRKRELEDRHTSISSTINPTKRILAEMDRSMLSSTPIGTTLLRGDVSRYMSAQGQVQSKPVLPAILHNQMSTAQPLAPVSFHNTGRNAMPNETIPRPATLCLPDIQATENADIQVIVSTGVMARRSLMERLQQTLPNTILIEREVRLLDMQAVCERQEADLTISATEGIVLTTLQKLGQKPLPGQSDRHSTRVKLARMAGMYRRLLVLVSEANPEPDMSATRMIQTLDDRDCEAISDMTAWSCSFETTAIQVQYVAGGEAELCGWICAFISKACLMATTHRLAPEESLWERFLRVAGMNAFMAQKILARLKEFSSQCDLADNLPSPKPRCTRPSDLALFAMMPRTQRSAFVNGSLFGTAAIKQLGEALGTSWFQQLQAR